MEIYSVRQFLFQIYHILRVGLLFDLLGVASIICFYLKYPASALFDLHSLFSLMCNHYHVSGGSINFLANMEAPDKKGISIGP